LYPDLRKTSHVYFKVKSQKYLLFFINEDLYQEAVKYMQNPKYFFEGLLRYYSNNFIDLTKLKYVITSFKHSGVIKEFIIGAK